MVILVLLQGCAAVGPDYEAPEIDMPDAWHEALTEGLAGGESGLDTWWMSFDDPVLNGLIQRAADANLSLLSALSRIDEARATVGIASGQHYPEANTSALFERSQTSKNTVPRGFRATDQSLYSVGFDVAWEIDLFGRIRRSVESADASLQASVENYRDVLVVLYAEVASGYVDVRTLQKRLEIASANVEVQKKTLELTKNRFDSGLVPRLDVTQAESNLANTESQIPLIDTQLVWAYNRLSVLLGEHPGALRDELAATAAIPLPPDSLLVGVPADLLRQRPDVRQAERLLAAQHAQIGVAVSDMYPRFSLTGSFAWQARNNEDVFDASSRAYGIGPSIRWNIFNGFRTKSTIRAEEERTRQALLGYEQTVLLALEEVENTLAAFAREKTRQASLSRAVDATRESVSLVEQLYVDGLTNFQNVLDTERSLFAQEDAFIESQGLVTKYMISLYKALGGGWRPEAQKAAK